MGGRYRPSQNTLFLAFDEIHAFTPEQLRKTMWHEMGHWLHDKAQDRNAHPRLQKWRSNIESHWRDRTTNEPMLRHPAKGWLYILDNWIKAYAGRIYGRMGGLDTFGLSGGSIVGNRQNRAVKQNLFRWDSFHRPGNI